MEGRDSHVSANCLRGIAAGSIVLYGSHGEVEYDLVLAPGADVKSILLNFNGARRLRRDDTGSLVAECEGLTVIQRRPNIYQELAGRKVPVSGDYSLRGKHRVGFRLAAYNESKTLVIDPALTFSTIFGGNGADPPKRLPSIQRKMYVVGYFFDKISQSLTPISRRCRDRQPAIPGTFSSQLDPTGSTVLFSTYLGGAAGKPGGASLWMRLEVSTLRGQLCRRITRQPRGARSNKQRKRRG